MPLAGESPRLQAGEHVKYTIGVVGYSAQKFDIQLAKEYLNFLMGKAVAGAPRDADIQISSGLTYLGIPALAYDLAKRMNLKTVGVACSQAKNYDCFPVDEEIIVGDNWGDESETFLKSLDVIIRVGGGKQSHAEVERAKAMGITVLEVDFPAS